MSDYDAWMDERAEQEEERLMEQYYEQLNDYNDLPWNVVDEITEENTPREITGEEDTQEEEYSGVEDDDDTASVSTEVIYPSVASTTSQGAYIYCRPRQPINHIIGYDSD